MDDMNELLKNEDYFNQKVALSPFDKQLKDTINKAILAMIALYAIVIFFGIRQSWFIFGFLLITFFGVMIFLGIRRMYRMYALYHATSKKELFELYHANPQPYMMIKPFRLNDVYQLRVQVRGDVINQTTQEQLETQIQPLLNNQDFVSLLLSMQKTKNIRKIIMVLEWNAGILMFCQ